MWSLTVNQLFARLFFRFHIMFFPLLVFKSLSFYVWCSDSGLLRYLKSINAHISYNLLRQWIPCRWPLCNDYARTLYKFNGAETNCGIAHILGILLMNSCNTEIFFSNYYHLQSVHFEYKWWSPTHFHTSMRHYYSLFISGSALETRASFKALHRNNLKVNKYR